MAIDGAPPTLIAPDTPLGQERVALAGALGRRPRRAPARRSTDRSPSKQQHLRLKGTHGGERWSSFEGARRSRASEALLAAHGRRRGDRGGRRPSTGQGPIPTVHGAGSAKGWRRDCPKVAAPTTATRFAGAAGGFRRGPNNGAEVPERATSCALNRWSSSWPPGRSIGHPGRYASPQRVSTARGAQTKHRRLRRPRGTWDVESFTASGCWRRDGGRTLSSVQGLNGKSDYLTRAARRSHKEQATMNTKIKTGRVRSTSTAGEEDVTQAICGPLWFVFASSSRGPAAAVKRRVLVLLVCLVADRCR